MKIYFAASIRGGNDDAVLYAQIIKVLGQYGSVSTEHIGDSSYLTAKGKEMTRAEIYRQDMNWLTEADVVVAEVTTPSLGVGYEIAKAEDLGKKILCLFRENSGRNLSAMIGGNPSFQVINYTDLDDAAKAIQIFFESLK